MARCALQCERSPRRGDGPEAGSAERAVRIIELRRIGQIEGLGPKFNAASSIRTEGEGLKQRAIELFCAGSVQDIAARVSEELSSGARKRFRVEPTLNRTLVGWQRPFPEPICACARTDVERVVRGRDGEGKTAIQAEDAIELPAFDNLPGKTGGMEWQSVAPTRDHPVTNIIIGVAAVQPDVTNVHDAAKLRSHVNRMTVGVSDLEREPGGEPPLGCELQAMIGRVKAVLDR